VYHGIIGVLLGAERTVVGATGRASMSTFTVEVELPDALRELGFAEEEVRREVPMLLVLKRFREGRISSGKAARILGITRREFLDRLGREGIPIYDPTEEELEQEFQVLRSIQRTP
jgi:predicted HTH domain antitoxin